MVRRAVLVLALTALCASVTPAQDAGSVREGGVRLTLLDTLTAALENNMDLVAARISPAISTESVEIQNADFDLGLQAGVTANGFKREPRAEFETAGTGDTQSYFVGIQQNLRTGADYSIQLDSSQTNGDNVPFDPFYQTGLNLVFNQPLLGGLGKEVRQEQLMLARTNVEISEEDFRVQVQSTLEQVESAYWDLRAAEAALNVARQSLERAEDLLGQNRKKVEVGTLAPIEITQAEAGVASQEESVIVAETTLINSQDELLRLMGLPMADPIWDRDIVAVDNPTFEKRNIDIQSAFAKASENRPELIRARKELGKSELSERVAQKGLRHGLDLRLSANPFGNNNEGQVIGPGPDGVLGTLDDTFGFETASYGTSASEVFELENYSWNAQLTYTVPIGNKRAKANYRIAQLNTEQGEVSLENQLRNIRVEVRRAGRNVESGGKRVDAAQANVVLQRKKLEAEQKKFENGMTTSFEVLTFQNDLADAQLSMIRALTDYQKSLTAFEKAQGTLLESRGLAIEPL